MPGRTLRGRSSTWIDDDMSGSGGSAGVEELHCGRHRDGRVGSDKQDRLSFGDVGQWKGQSPIDAERPVRRRRCGRHAEASVVVDH
jgi:hypothetical protein